MIDIPCPLALHEEPVRPEWIDYNGHMNVAYYVLAFDHATDRFLEWIGLGERVFVEHSSSFFMLEAHVTYEREVAEGDPLRFTTQLLDWDHKRAHFFHMMYHATDGYLAATNELIGLHVDMTARRSAPFPEVCRQRLSALAAAHGRMPRPAQIGSVIGLSKKNPPS